VSKNDHKAVVSSCYLWSLWLAMYDTKWVLKTVVHCKHAISFPTIRCSHFTYNRTLFKQHSSLAL